MYIYIIFYIRCLNLHLMSSRGFQWGSEILPSGYISAIYYYYMQVGTYFKPKLLLIECSSLSLISRTIGVLKRGILSNQDLGGIFCKILKRLFPLELLVTFPIYLPITISRSFYCIFLLLRNMKIKLKNIFSSLTKLKIISIIKLGLKNVLH